MKKVIIIDDNKIQTNILENFFNKNSWEVFCFDNAKEAYEKIFHIAPDLIITDALMPNIGGFQFIKSVKSNDIISNIPIIVHSILPESNARLYLKENNGEYFVKKENNLERLLEVANEAIFKHPINENYKDTILAARYIEPKAIEIPEKKEVKREELTQEELKKLFLEKINFEQKHDFLIPNLLTKIHSILKFNLGILHISSNPDLKNKLFFDIENILLSPIFQFDILEKENVKEPILYKKYAPNLKTITNEEEFEKKEELEIKYHNQTLAKFIFYYLQNRKILSENETVLFKETLEEFFKKWHIINTLNQKEKTSSSDKYFQSETIDDIKADIQNKEVYCGIIKLNNIEEFNSIYGQEETNIVTSIISKEIKTYLDEKDKLNKTETDEYAFIIYADNKKEVATKLNYISNIINKLIYNTFEFKATIVAIFCNEQNSKITSQKAFDIAKETLINSQEDEKVIIK